MKISGNIPAKERKKGNTNPYLKDGFIPSIIYGGDADPLMVAVETIQLKKRFEEGGFYSKIFEVEIGDKKEAVVVKSIQRHKVKNNPTMNSKQKLNTAIKEINSQLFQIERFFKQNKRLKEEDSLNKDSYCLFFFLFQVYFH